jgi:hypothetical protein
MQTCHHLGDFGRERESFSRSAVCTKAVPRRETGFSSVWVGSANLSASALAGGLEWTMKSSEADLRHVVEMFRGSFDSLWEDPEFERIDPANDEQMERLERALRKARSGPASGAGTELLFDLRPHPFQEEILEQLTEERAGRGRHRNLIVAATGTGKTMLAGFDYARQPSRPNLLFLAHREELLRQARTSFRQILRDGTFGELLTGSETPAAPNALGPVRYLTHTGERPMGITWRLEGPMPAAVFEKFAALLAA